MNIDVFKVIDADFWCLNIIKKMLDVGSPDVLPGQPEQSWNNFSARWLLCSDSLGLLSKLLHMKASLDY